MIIRRAAVLFAVAVCSGSTPLLADNIAVTYNFNVVGAAANQNFYPYDEDFYDGTGIDGGATIEAIDGTSRSKMVIDWKNLGGATILNFAFDHERAGDLYDFAQAYDNTTRFTANANNSYSLSGRYDITDNGSDSGSVWFHTFLYDQTENTYLFNNYQYSMGTNDEQFTLGGTEGDTSNSLSGSMGLDGNLVAGHNYLFFFDASIHAYPEGDSGATATGYVNLTIGEVPTPTSFAALIGIGAMGLIAVARRRRK